MQVYELRGAVCYALAISKTQLAERPERYVQYAVHEET